MHLREMMGSLEINGKTYIERYTEILDSIKREQAERKRRTDLENLLAVHCFPETSKVIAKHQLVKWRHPTDLADALRYIFYDNISRRMRYGRYAREYRELNLPDSIEIQIPRPEGMKTRKHNRLCFSVGSVLRRGISVRKALDSLHKDPGKLAGLDKKTALQVEKAYQVIYDEGA